MREGCWMASVPTEASTRQLSLLLSSPKLWTLSTHPSWTRLCLSAGLLCPHVPYFPVTLLHTESVISLPSLVRNALLLAGKADLPRFRTLSVDSSQLPAPVLCVPCLHIRMSMRERAHVCVSVCLGGEKVLPRVHKLHLHHSFKNPASDTLQRQIQLVKIYGEQDFYNKD